jgi:hypothetical protein
MPRGKAKANRLMTYSIPKELYEFARDRTYPLVNRAFAFDSPIGVIAASCYQQGLADCVELIEKRGWPPWRDEPDYMI